MGYTSSEYRNVYVLVAAQQIGRKQSASSLISPPEGALSRDRRALLQQRSCSGRPVIWPGRHALRHLSRLSLAASHQSSTCAMERASRSSSYSTSRRRFATLALGWAAAVRFEACLRSAPDPSRNTLLPPLPASTRWPRALCAPLGAALLLPPTPALFLPDRKSVV